MKYVCPLCQSELREQVGDHVHPGDKDYGITLDCPNWKCPAQEVMGHGDNVDKAFAVIKNKFTKRGDRDE